MSSLEGSEASRAGASSEADKLPCHVAIIMDGNGRWAEERGLPRWMGHREGMKAVRQVVEGSLEEGIEHLTLFAFSRENWERPAEEVAALMNLLCEYVDRERHELAEQSVRVTVFGDLDPLPEEAMEAIRRLEETTRSGRRLHLHLAISYGGRDEIVHAARRIAEEVAAGSLDPADVTAKIFAGRLYTAEWPDPDLLIRTSGEMRVSNFLLWQIAYAEIHVTDVLWPDFGKQHLRAALADYAGRDRRFGQVR